MKKDNKKTAHLTKIEKTALKAYKETFKTEIAFANAVQVNRSTLLRIVEIGKGKPENLIQIRKVLKETQTVK